MRSYEKTVLLLISFIVTAIVTFCLGVERGKALNPKVAQAPLLPATTAVAKPEAVIQKQPLPQTQPQAERYTIQVASYKSAKYAQEEAQRLKKQGFSTAIIAKGAYTVLYVGNFSNKEEAREFLNEIKKQKRYADSTIRRL
jgi:cell division protein FtsN